MLHCSVIRHQPTQTIRAGITLPTQGQATRRTRKQYTTYPQADTQPEHQHKILGRIPHQTRTQYSRHIGEHHQKFGNTRHKENDNEKYKEKRRKKNIYIYTF
jgi:hypothetical protein